MTFNSKIPTSLEVQPVVIDGTIIEARSIIFDEGQILNVLWFKHGRFSLSLDLNIKDAEALQTMLTMHINNIRQNEKTLAIRAELDAE